MLLKTLKYVLFICFIGSSCTKSASQDIKTVESKVKILRKIILNTEDYYPGASARFYGIISNQDNKHFDIMNVGKDEFIRYDTTGKVIKVISRQNIKQDYELPNGPAVFDFSGDTLLLLYPLNNTIYKFLNECIVGKIILHVPKNEVIVRGTPFFYYPENSTCIVSAGRNVEKTKDFFPSSRPLQIFSTSTGKFIKSFGKYPKEYAQGAYISSAIGFQKQVKEKDKIYLIFPNFDNILTFDNKGNELATTKVPTIYRDTTLRVSNRLLDDISDEEVKKTFNDSYVGGLAKSINKDVFFRLYTSYKEKKEVLVMYDAKSKLQKEVLLPRELSSSHLFPVAYDNKCYLFVANGLTDDVYIYEVVIE